MKCHLCEKEIDHYSADYNHLVLDNQHAVDICLACIEKFDKWRGKNLAVLFPTKALKKRYGGKT